jgi:ABC-type sugar transport system permease subunit
MSAEPAYRERKSLWRFVGNVLYDLRVGLSRGKTRKSRGVSAGKRGALIFYILMLAWPTAQFAVFYLGVNINSVLLAFKEYDVAANTFRWVGFESFSRAWNLLFLQADMKSAFTNAILNQLLGYVIPLPLSLFFSYYVYKKMFGYKTLRVVLFVPSLISGVIMVLIYTHFAESVVPEVWQKLFGKKLLTGGGLLSNAATSLGTVLFYGIWLSFGGSVLFYSSSMSQISESVIEAAQLDGTNNMQELWYIVLPSIYPVLAMFLTLGVSGFLTNDLGLYSFFLMNAPDRLKTVGYYMTQMTLRGSVPEYPRLSAMGLILTATAVPLTLATKKLLERFGPSAD